LIQQFAHIDDDAKGYVVALGEFVVDVGDRSESLLKIFVLAGGVFYDGTYFCELSVHRGM
jgi:hypothetical protein